MGGVIEYVKLSIFSKGGAGAGAGTSSLGEPPTRLEAGHVQRARIILEAGGEITFDRWQKEILPQFGGHEAVARQALGQARREMLQAMADEINPV